MRVALINPAWDFAHSIYFGCRDPHLPLELGYTSALLEAHGHETLMLDGMLDGLTAAELAQAVAAFAPDMAVVTTAPSYLFWRCAPPELRVPRDMIARLRAVLPGCGTVTDGQAADSGTVTDSRAAGSGTVTDGRTLGGAMVTYGQAVGGAMVPDGRALGGGTATDERTLGGAMATDGRAADGATATGGGAGGGGTVLVLVGPHGSTTPAATLRKTGADVVVQGECEDAVLALAGQAGRPQSVPGAAWLDRSGALRGIGGPQAARFIDTPALRWPAAWIARHAHHHHRFDRTPTGPGAEVEASRGCPYSCSFCAKIDFRDAYRRRQLGPLLEEIDGLIAQGVTYVYFIDEIFLPQRPLLEALCERRVEFGIQTRIDLWKPDMLALMGRAGCVSIEAGVESLSVAGRAALDKNCRMTTEDLTERLILARRHVPFVQANLILSAGDDAAEIAAWRARLRDAGVWANDPVPLFPYPGSPDYRKRWGMPDDAAWERAHAHYLGQFDRMSDIQEQVPLPLPALECLPC